MTEISEQENAQAAPLHILLLEDDDSLRSSLVLNLRHAGYETASVASGAEALSLLAREPFDIVLCDLMMPEMDGLSFLQKSKELIPSLTVLVMTAFGDSDTALRVIRAGAYDYLTKPFTVEELVLTLRKIEERERLRHENEDLRSVINQRYSFVNIIAQSEKMKNIFDTVTRLANFNTTVLVTGESGTGKELLARAIHHNSPRRGKPFVAINCGAIPENLMESELFGHKAGAFTDASRDKRGLFEEASGGTIFLDEIGELPLHLQVKLLRVLQEQKLRRVGDETMIPIDVRVIAATLRDLDADVLRGRFRDDLYYRLNVVSIHLPPLRERSEDIPVLVQSFMKKHNKRLGLNVKKIEPDALKCLLNYGWKGNVRELENCVERALVLTESEVIDMASLPDPIRAAGEIETQLGQVAFVNENTFSIKKATRSLEISLILKALKKTSGNRTHAAKILEISHRALLYKLKEYGLGENAAKREE